VTENSRSCHEPKRLSRKEMSARLLKFPTFVAMLALTAPLLAQDVKPQADRETLLGPASRANRDSWLAAMKAWRQDERIRLNYTDAQYSRPELRWGQSSFIQPQAMVEDRYFYDPVAGRYTVERFLADLDERYGGIDSVLLWPVYPNIGIDSRSQHDLLHDLPGGLAGIRTMVDDFHRHNVHVLFPVMPWDTGTHRPDLPFWDAALRDMKAIGADGINGDTYNGVPRDFLTASEAEAYPLVLEPENHLDRDEMLSFNTMSWGYWKYRSIPVISTYKWLEPRHMVNVCERWAHDRTDGLQSAFFNGVGYESWENVWGIWNQITPRDAAALRRISFIYRAFPGLLVSHRWEPHVATLQSGIYASIFPAEGQALWLVVNREHHDSQGRQLSVPHREHARYYDLWHGIELQPDRSGARDILGFEVEARGFGAVLANYGPTTPAEVERFLSRAARLGRTPLGRLSSDHKVLRQHLVEIAATRTAAAAPEGMIAIPGGKFRFKVSGVEIEGGDAPGVDVQYPWEDVPRRHHDHELEIKSFYIDRYPVTQAQFKRFLDATHYRPRDDHNFLKDWNHGSPPSGWDRKPVTWVSLADARAYAVWAGKRLPHEWEWQYAAQGTDGRPFPWGSKENPHASPQPEGGTSPRPPTDVDGSPQGASPFGVRDLMGNIWQWTDEYVDEHTRAAIVRGGGFYRPSGSLWYFPRNTNLNQHGKYLLMAPCKDRSSMIGFRCVVDAP
jgi:gamma-glutamyl hercynylcysteine S-oxide synthase